MILPARVSSIKKLAIILQSNLSMKNHVDALIILEKRSTYYRYALNIFKHHSTKTSDQQVFNSKNNHETHICLPTWYGWSYGWSSDSLLRQSKKYGFYPEDGDAFDELYDQAVPGSRGTV